MRNNIPERLRFALSVVLVGAASTLPYLSTLPHYFLTDDFGLVQLFGDKPAWHFLTLFTQSYAQGTWGFTTDEIRPFPALLYQAGALAGAASPILQHAISIALHSLTALLVLAVTRQVASTSWAAGLFSAVLFCVLPVHVETVAWITGRVDSLFALAYGLSFLGFVLWRRTGATAHLAWSVAAYFVALYSKQPAITLPATLVFYDWLVRGRKPTLAWSGWKPYLPYFALTFAMLVLRYVLFGNFIREDTLPVATFVTQFVGIQARYVQLVVIGEAPLTTAQLLLPPVVALLFALVAMRPSWRRLPAVATTALESKRLRIALFFLPAWWLTTTAPLIVAGYASGRFLYLTAIGLTVGLGSVLEALLESREPRYRIVAACGAVTLVALALAALLPKVVEMNMEATVSKSILREIRAETADLPEGSLLVISENSRPWGYSIPFALQPPFTEVDLTAKYAIVCPPMTYFHPQSWFADMQAEIDKWLANPHSPPIVVLRWDPSTGRHARGIDRDLPELRVLARDLATATSEPDLARRLQVLLARVAP